MYCPTCNSQNLPTDLRCIQCGTSLVGETVGGSTAYRENARALDARMYGGIGAFLGFVLMGIFCRTFLAGLDMSDWQTWGAATVSAVVFGALGRVIASRQY